MDRLPIHKKCTGCERTVPYLDYITCIVYMFPEAKWRIGDCPMATHIKREAEVKQKVNPIKASKREAKKRKGK